MTPTVKVKQLALASPDSATDSGRSSVGTIVAKDTNMEMRNAMLLLSLIIAPVGCLSTDHTVSGRWTSERIGGCSDAFFYSDTVDLTVSDVSGAIVKTASYSCSDKAFEVQIPGEVDGIRIEASAYATGDSGERLDSGTAKLEVLHIVDDVDVGTLHFILP